jgi:tRNA (guanine6-N2)-methyltransferase
MSLFHREMKYIAYTTKGLEEITKEEISHQLINTSFLEVETKRIVFDIEAAFDVLAELKTVDDLGILIGKTETSRLDDIIPYAESLNFNEVLNQIRNLREVKENFSITVSLTGVQGYKSPDLVNKLSQVISNKTGLTYLEKERSNFDVRVFIDHEEVYISVRLTENSLQHRKYKTFFNEGSLKPTIAAAMVQMVCNWKNGLKVVDNFCGSGTILAEALLAGNQVYGGDIDPDSVQMTTKNLLNLDYVVEDKIKVLDATQTNWPNSYFDCAISNLPWGKQVEINSITDLYAGTIKEYRRILKSEGKLCLIVSNPELLIKYTKQFFPENKITEIKIGYLGQNPTIVLAS